MTAMLKLEVWQHTKVSTKACIHWSFGTTDTQARKHARSALYELVIPAAQGSLKDLERPLIMAQRG